MSIQTKVSVEKKMFALLLDEGRYYHVFQNITIINGYLRYTVERLASYMIRDLYRKL